MLVFGTQVHIVTFIFIVLEFMMFSYQLVYFLSRPNDRNRLLYLLLLILMLVYNITGGLFPDPKIHIPIAIQEMIAYGTGFLMASYFPYYFYKAFGLKSLRWHAMFGVPLFLMLPYVLFFVVDYTLHGNLSWDLKFGMIAPLIYALILLWQIFRAIRKKYRANRNKKQFLEEIAMHVAVTPWAALAFFGLVEQTQVVEVLCTNTGIILITFLFITREIERSRKEHQLLQELRTSGVPPEVLEENCRHYQISAREREVLYLLRQGLKPGEIGERLFIAERTVTTHIQNMFTKTATRSRLELIRKLEQRRID